MMAALFSLEEFVLVFFRTAACVMILPGLSMSQLPMRVRLFAAAAITLAVQALVDSPSGMANNVGPSELFLLIFHEMVIGVALALPLRLLFSALTFLGEIIVQFMGLNAIPGTPIGEDQAMTVMSSLFNITAVVILLSTGMLEGFVIALAMSYETLPIGALLQMGEVLQMLAGQLDEFFSIMLRLGSPLIIYAILLNLLAGLVNKLTPSIPIYFVSTPFLICGGLVILVWTADDMMFLFNVEVGKIIDAL